MSDLNEFEESIDAVADVCVERCRQEQLKAEGQFRHTCADLEMDNATRLAVLGEEFGEVCKELQDGGTVENLRKELIQVAAVAVAWVEAIDKGAGK